MIDVNVIELLKAKDSELEQISKKNVLSLSLVEMKAIQAYFKKQGANPTDIELETIAQTWSEHCKHKTLTGIVNYREKTKGKKDKVKTYKNLLKETVFRATQELDKPWCVSVFSDNAGIIEFDDKNGVAFKVETHNHPSALEPYGGAATGIGGVIRDILGVGLGGKPIANTDVFCFGLPDTPWAKVPKGVLHPKRIAKGVVSGVRDYGNRMGIPTVNGSVYFDEGYALNPLVYCGTLGIIPKDKAFKKVKPGDLVLVAGGRTGRDGIHGATFSSVQLDDASDVSAVQIGNPIVEKKVLDTLLRARDLGLYRALTDCGAGGLSSAVGELGSECGVKVHLDLVPLKYSGLRPWEIWVSEAQERMVFAVPKENKEKILKVFESENVEAVFIGEFTNDKKLTLYNGDIKIAQLDMDFLHDGVPKQKREAVWVPKEISNLKFQISNYTKDLHSLLSSYNICSKEWIIRQYDHEVMGQTVIKPLQGKDLAAQGPGDAAVIWPYAVIGQPPASSQYRGVVLSNGLNPEYGKIDPYWMTASAIDEALRNAVCVGGDIEKMAILDNFCFGNPNRPEILGGVVRAAEACYDMAKGYGVPFISGKDSLHNEYSVAGKVFSIPPALLISAVGIVKDIRKTITMDLKKEGNYIYVLGQTKNELGGSHYLKIKNAAGGDVPKVDAKTSRALMKKLGFAIENGSVSSCHDCSEGGLAVALAEMSFAGHLGMDVELSKLPVDHGMNDTQALFSESNSRFIVEVNPEKAKEFEKAMSGSVFAKIGTVAKHKKLSVKGINGKIAINEDISKLMESWRETLKW